MELSTGPDCDGNRVPLVSSGFAQNSTRANAGGRVLGEKPYPRLFVQLSPHQTAKPPSGCCSVSSRHRWPQRRTGPLRIAPAQAPEVWPGSWREGWPVIRCNREGHSKPLYFQMGKSKSTAFPFHLVGYFLHAAVLSNGFICPDYSCH